MVIGNDPLYFIQDPLSIRYLVDLIPDVPSVAVRVAVTLSMYHSFSPRVPVTVRAVSGGVLSTVKTDSEESWPVFSLSSVAVTLILYVFASRLAVVSQL